jgi:hypothetical protein
MSTSGDSCCCCSCLVLVAIIIGLCILLAFLAGLGVNSLAFVSF